jgi:hypothetical protein
MPEVKVLERLCPSRHLYLSVLLFVKDGTYLSLALQQAFYLGQQRPTRKYLLIVRIYPTHLSGHPFPVLAVMQHGIPMTRS